VFFAKPEEISLDIITMYPDFKCANQWAIRNPVNEAQALFINVDGSYSWVSGFTMSVSNPIVSNPTQDPIGTPCRAEGKNTHLAR
jgi:hypothetical protein